jgi:hypothetical protein
MLKDWDTFIPMPISALGRCSQGEWLMDDRGMTSCRFRGFCLLLFLPVRIGEASTELLEEKVLI